MMQLRSRRSAYRSGTVRALVRREIGGQAIRIAQLPAADKTIVTGIAFQIDAEEHLRAILGSLQRTGLARTDIAPPIDTYKKALRVILRSGIEQLGNKLIVRQIFAQRFEQPGRNRFAVSGIVHSFVVAQKIVPIADPILRVVVFIGQQPADERLRLSADGSLRIGPAVRAKAAAPIHRDRRAGRIRHQRPAAPA